MINKDKQSWLCSKHNTSQQGLAQKMTRVLIQVFARRKVMLIPGKVKRPGCTCRSSVPGVKGRKARPSEARGHRTFLIAYWAGWFEATRKSVAI